MGAALKDAQTIYSIVPSQFVRSTGSGEKFSPKPEIVISLTKGIEQETLKSMIGVLKTNCPPRAANSS